MGENNLLGKYQHFKNKKLYEVIGFAVHSETKEEMLVYKALYASPEYEVNQIWVRPKVMFFEEVEHEGDFFPRFKKVAQATWSS